MRNQGKVFQYKWWSLISSLLRVVVGVVSSSAASTIATSLLEACAGTSSDTSVVWLLHWLVKRGIRRGMHTEVVMVRRILIKIITSIINCLRRLRLVLIIVPLIPLIWSMLVHLILLVVSKAIITRCKVCVDVYADVDVVLWSLNLLLVVLISLITVHVVIAHELLLVRRYLITSVHLIIKPAVIFKTFFLNDLLLGLLWLCTLWTLVHSVVATCHLSLLSVAFPSFFGAILVASRLSGFIIRCKLRVLFNKTIIDLYPKLIWVLQFFHVWPQFLNKHGKIRLMSYRERFLNHIVSILIKQEVVERVSWQNLKHHRFFYFWTVVLQAFLNDIGWELFPPKLKQIFEKLLTNLFVHIDVFEF